MNLTDDLVSNHALRMALCETLNEWQTARHLRQKYFFDKQPIDDPYTWTFGHRDHIHFVLYQKQDIIGYTHVQLWPMNRAAIRIIVIDEGKRNNAFGTYFMCMIESWLQDRGVKSIHVEATPSAKKFYTHNGYEPLPFGDPDGYKRAEEDIDMGKLL